VTAGATFRHALARHDLVFDETAPGVWTVFPDGITRRTGLDIDVTARLDGRHLLGFSLTLEGTRNTATARAIPYVPTVQGAARYEHRFLFGLEAGASLTVVGERTVTLAADRSVGAFALLDMFAEYPLIERMTIRGVLNNCANVSHRWWDGYRPVPRSVAVSLGYTW
jgi:outer membrane receptor protein involved in Fe transport